MKWIVIITLAIFCISCSSGNYKSAEKILFDKVVAASKNSDGKDLSDDDFEKISEYMSQGKERWIRLYPILNKEPFLGVASLQEGLNIAMAYALSDNPGEVLKFVDDNNVGEICGAPFIEPTDDEINNYFVKTNIALNKLKTGGCWKDRCLFNLRRTMTGKSSSVNQKESLGCTILINEGTD